MSNYRALAYHPQTGRLEVCTVGMDEAADRTVWSWSDFSQVEPYYDSHPPDHPDVVDLFEIAQEMAVLVGSRGCPMTRGLMVEECAKQDCILCAALSRWQQFTNAKETKDGS